MTQTLSKLARDLKPYIVSWINAAVQGGPSAGGGGGGGLSQHALDGFYHTGVIGNNQATQFPLLAGGRTYTGSLVLLAGLTVDGVDLSEHAANPTAHHALASAGNTGISVAGQAVSLALAGTSGLQISSGLMLADAVAGAGLGIAGKILAVGAGAGITVNADDVALTTPGSLSNTTTNTAAGNHTHAVTASVDVGTTPVAALLKSTGAGGLVLGTLTVKGSVDVVNGGDLTVGSNVLFVDVSTNSVGIGGQAPDPQFALDVNGPIRGTELIGKLALQLKNVIFMAHYDGGYPYYTNFTGDLNSVINGRTPSEIGYHTFRPGKFYKGILLGTATTNLVTNPSFEVNVTSGWDIFNGAGGDMARARVATDSWVGDYCMKLTSTALDNSQINSWTLGTGNGTQAYACSVYLRANVSTTVQLILERNGPSYEDFGTSTVSVTTEWQRFYVTGTPTNTHAFRLTIMPQVAAVDIYVDGAQCEANSSPRAYCDGSLGDGLLVDGYAWTGTAHLSTSTRATGNYIAYNAITIPRQFSLMAWVRPECLPGSTADYQAAYAIRIGTNDRISLELQPAGSWRFTRVVNGVSSFPVMSGGNAAWQTWQHHCTVYDGVGSLKHYINGAEVYSGTVSPLFTFGSTWALDLANNGFLTYYGNFTLDDVVVLDAALVADKVRAIYESDAPVFAESSQTAFRATQRGLVWADEEGLWMRDVAGNPVMGFYGGEAATKSWGGLNLEVGDMLIGRSPSGYLHWDDSLDTLVVAGQITIQNPEDIGYSTISGLPTSLGAINSGEGTKLSGIAAGATVGATWGTNLNSIPARFGETPGAAGLYLTPSGLGYYNGSAWRTYLASSGNFYFGGTAGATLAWDGTDLYGTDGTTRQWFARASTGKLYAGGGNLIIDVTGLSLAVLAAPAETASVSWKTGGVVDAKIDYYKDAYVSSLRLANDPASRDNHVQLTASGGTGKYGSITLSASGNAGAVGASLSVTGGASAGNGTITIIADKMTVGAPIAAYDAAGLTFQDDGGNTAMTISDGAYVGIRMTSSLPLSVEGDVLFRGTEGADGLLYLYADQGDDQPDRWRFRVNASTGQFTIEHYESSVWTAKVTYG